MTTMNLRLFTCITLLALLLQESHSFANLSARNVGRSAFVRDAFTGSSSSVPLWKNLECSLFRTNVLEATQDDTNFLLNNRHSASDWLYNVRSIPQSGVLREIRNPLLAVGLWSFTVSVVQRRLLQSGQSFMQQMAIKMCIPATAHSFLVSSLGLLLVFRTNSAYQRFYEGRKIWENILSISRNLSRMITLYSKEVGVERQQRLVNLIAAYPYLLKHHIRSGCLCENGDEIEEPYRIKMHEPSVLPVDSRYEGDKSVIGGTTKLSAVSIKPRECWVDSRNLPWSLFERPSLDRMARTNNRPLWVCDRLGQEIMGIRYGPNYTSRERLSLLGHVEKLTNAVGQCERIHQTAVPLNYARHSLRSLTLWLFSLPFALVKDLGLLTAPVNFCIAWLLYGIYQIGYSIEDPFQGSLRLSILCDAIRRDVLGEIGKYSDDVRDSAYTLEDTWEEPEINVDDIHSATSMGVLNQARARNSVPLSIPLNVERALFRDEARVFCKTPKLIREHSGNLTLAGLVKN